MAGKVVPLAAPRPEAEIRAAISSTSRAAVYKALGAGKPFDAAMSSGLVQVSGAASREVMNGGRDTITEAVQRDPRAQGWARVTGGDPCAFCAMLAGRGPVYKEDTAGFDAHDHCSCDAEPVYEGSEWPGRGREFQRRWYESDRTLNGFRQDLSKTPGSVFASPAGDATGLGLESGVSGGVNDFVSSGAYRELTGMSEDGFRAFVASGPGDSDPLLGKILAEKGFDGPPAQVVDSLSGHLPEGTEMWRGVGAGYGEAFKTGDLYPGAGVFGNGSYFAVGDEAAGRALSYAGPRGDIVHAVLPRLSSVVEYDDLMGIYRSTLAKLQARIDSAGVSAWSQDRLLMEVLSDPGRFAALMGHDAIKARGGGYDMLVLLNRSKLIVEH